MITGEQVMRKLDIFTMFVIFAFGCLKACTQPGQIASESQVKAPEALRAASESEASAAAASADHLVQAAPTESSLLADAAPTPVVPVGVSPGRQLNARSIAPDRVVDLWTRLISKDSGVIVRALVDLADEDPVQLRALRYSSDSDRGWIDQHPPTLMMHEGRGIEWQQDADGRWIRLFKSDPRWKSLPQATKVRAMIALDHFTTGVLLSAQTARSRVMLEECFTGRIAAIGELDNNREGSPEAQAYDVRALAPRFKGFGSKYNYFMDPKLRPEPSEVPLSP